MFTIFIEYYLYIAGNNSRYKRIKLENQDNEEKTIKLCGSHIGTYNIIQKKDGKEFFALLVKKAKYNFRGDDFCDSWIDGKLYYNTDTPFEEVKLNTTDDVENVSTISHNQDSRIPGVLATQHLRKS
ncbi:hypothetical protein IHO40_01420 [Wolbachia endosymbiont of Mansonella ozzardi]|nr:hypothetical protein [Wolbachia endosymbiont of Mansonella ozzardi]